VLKGLPVGVVKARIKNPLMPQNRPESRRAFHEQAEFELLAQGRAEGVSVAIGYSDLWKGVKG